METQRTSVSSRAESRSGPGYKAFHMCMGSNPPDVVGFLQVLRFPPTSSSHICVSRIHCIYVRLIFNMTFAVKKGCKTLTSKHEQSRFGPGTKHEHGPLTFHDLIFGAPKWPWDICTPCPPLSAPLISYPFLAFLMCSLNIHFYATAVKVNVVIGKMCFLSCMAEFDHLYNYDNYLNAQNMWNIMWQLENDDDINFVKDVYADDLF